MLKSVLAAMPAYTMSCFKLPNSLYKRIQSALTRFWWDASMEKKKMCWVSWKKLTKAKGEGGLGFRDLQGFNDALLAKLSWRILTKPDCLLAKTLLGKYCHSSSFLDCKVRTATSHGWRGICVGRDLLKTQLGRVIGNGNTTRLWHDPWISLSSPQRPMGPAPEHTQDWLVSELISTESLDWDKEKVRQTFPELEQEILGLRLSSLGAADTYAWLPSKTGAYTAKSGYYEYLKAEAEPTQDQCQGENKGFNWSKEIWNIKSSPKMKFLLWKAMRGALPLGENLKARKIAIATGCPFCGEEESALHLFFKCSFANSVWKLAPFKTSIASERLSSFREGIEASKLLVCLPPTGVNAGPLLPWIIWAIWIARNQKIFQDKTAIPMETLVHAITIAKEWQQAQEPISESNHKPIKLSTRNRVEAGVVYCQTDAAWIESQRAAGFGWILSNRLESFRQEGTATSLHIRSPLMAEIVAIHLAIQNALALGITNLSIASDSKQAIEAIKSKQPSKELHGILHDILILSLNFCKISFNFIPREENQEADALAKSSLKTLVSEP